MSFHMAIVGSGQLAQMMAQAGIPMGMSFSFLAESGEDTRCVDTLGKVAVREVNQRAAELYRNLGEPEVITVEKEHVDIDLLTAFTEFCPVHPNPKALEKFKNRRTEKEYLQSRNIPISPFYPVSSEQDLRAAVANLAAPVFLKSEEQGYDGYNQHTVTPDSLEALIAKLGFPGRWVAEAFVPFQREISFLAARGPGGEVVFYPAVENRHHEGTLLTSVAPAPDLSAALCDTGRRYIQDLLEALDYVGMMCMECFVRNDEILVNEIAPRVHNSGHWTSKGSLTSQFENHVRAVSGVSLGSTASFRLSGMLNLLGVTLSAQQCGDAYLTLYGKSQRPRRKLGHVTVNDDSYDTLKSRLQALERLAYNA